MNESYNLALDREALPSLKVRVVILKNRYRCPKCSFWLSSTQMRRRDNPYFEWPSCAAKLCISPTYMRFLFYAGLVLGWAVPAILRIGNPFLFIAVGVLAWVPAGMAFTTFLQFVYPPRITFYSSDFSNPLSLTQNKKDDP